MWSKTFFLILLLALAAPAWTQTPPAQKGEPELPVDKRYGNMPDEAVPFRNFSKAYYEWFIQENTLEYNGAARDRENGDVEHLKEVAIGFLGPLENNPESVYGIPMLHGAQLAIEEANARGGYHGKPYVLKLHNDSALWGASSGELVKMLLDENCWVMLGSIDGQSTHIALRVTLKLELPIVSPGTTDPTVTETRIQWLLHSFIDDRQQCYAVADHVFKDLKLKRVAVIRTQARYARMGVQKFNDQARRMGHQVIMELKFDRGDKDFSRQVRMLKDANLDGVVIWGESPEAGLILKQMRAAGLDIPAFAGSRVCYKETLDIAGPAAEGLVCTTPLDPTRADPQWVSFRERYRRRFGEEPIDYAAYAYDAMNMIMGAVEKAGLNRGRIMDALREHRLKEYRGVSGVAFFDNSLNNVGQLTFARVKNGKFEYWPVPPRQVTLSADEVARKD